MVKTNGNSNVTLTDESIAYISKSLPRYDWIRLAYLLGFVHTNIAYFNMRASSSENHYSQCHLMLTTWRSHMTSQSLVPRLCEALRRMRRTDLAVKIGTEITLGKLDVEENKKTAGGKKRMQLTTRTNHVMTPREETRNQVVDEDDNKLVFPDENINYLAMKLINDREEWKWLAYALGLLPEDVAHVIGRASSGDNRFVQVRYMLVMWRSRTNAQDIPKLLKEAFIRIRRSDLSHLYSLGKITNNNVQGRNADGQKDETQAKTEKTLNQKSFGERMATHIPDYINL